MPTQTHRRYSVHLVMKTGARRRRYASGGDHTSYALALVSVVRNLKSGNVKIAYVFDRQTKKRVGYFNARKNPFGLTQSGA